MDDQKTSGRSAWFSFTFHGQGTSTSQFRSEVCRVRALPSLLYEWHPQSLLSLAQKPDLFHFVPERWFRRYTPALSPLGFWPVLRSPATTRIRQSILLPGHKPVSMLCDLSHRNQAVLKFVIDSQPPYTMTAWSQTNGGSLCSYKYKR